MTPAANLSMYGVGGINRPVYKPQNRYHHSYTPLHIAVEKGHLVRWICYNIINHRTPSYSYSTLLKIKRKAPNDSDLYYLKKKAQKLVSANAISAICVSQEVVHILLEF